MGNGGETGGAQMRESVQQRVGGVARGRRAGLPREQHAQRIHAKTHALAQVVECFEGEWDAQRLGGSFERKPAE